MSVENTRSFHSHATSVHLFPNGPPLQSLSRYYYPMDYEFFLFFLFSFSFFVCVSKLYQQNFLSSR